MTNATKYPGADIAELDSHRCEIELGYRGMTQDMLQNQLTLRSNTPELVTQEFWGMLMAYNLLRFLMYKRVYVISLTICLCGLAN
ncbi:transposase [Vibrio sp. ABG19]|nr:transposase [Vibrio sp. ABG19]